MLKIVTDSTCDLPEALISQYDITVVPLYLNIGQQSYREGVDLSREAFYTGLPDYDPFPTTAAPSVGQFKTAYERLIERGASEILSIHVAAGLSATYNNARLAAQAVTAVPVTVFNSQQVTLGLGFMVLAAAKAITTGQPVAEIIPLLERRIPRTHIFAALDTLEYLKRSGRINQVTASLGSLLQIKPLIKIHRDEITAERVRTGNRALQRLLALAEEIAPLEQVALIHSHALEKTDTLRQIVAHLLPEADPLCVEVTPVLGTHVGPGGVGLACVMAER